jgi:hypothetical protein
VTSSSFDFRLAQHRLRFTFSEDVSASLGADDVAVRNLTTGETLPASAFTPSYDAAANAVTYTYTPGRLPDGNYRATLAAAGVRDRAGNAMAADQVLQFFFLTGDINRDRAVNGSDFAILAGNFGKTAMTYADGDLNGDGSVNGSDFALLAGSFGKSLPEPAAVAAAAVAPQARAVPQRPVKPARRVVRVASPPKAPAARPAARDLPARASPRHPATAAIGIASGAAGGYHF